MIKFNNIPKFTSPGYYKCNVPLVHVQRTIYDKFVGEYGAILNSEFQRGHVWTEAQQVRFIEFLLAEGYSGKDIYFNAPSWRRGITENMYLVDGLQRLTAAKRFLDNEIKAYGHYFKEYDMIPYNIDFIINVNELKSYREVLIWYVQLNKGGTVHSLEEIERVEKLIKKY